MRQAHRRRWMLAAIASAATLTAGGLAVTGEHMASAATAGCQVNYSVTSQWPGGFGANVTSPIWATRRQLGG